MTALLEAQEPSARYLGAVAPALVRQFELLATAPGGVARLRELILSLAIRGKLVPQDPRDPTATELLEALRAEKQKLVASGKAKPDKKLPSIAGAEIPFELPPQWAWVRLGELAELITSGSRDWAEHYSTSGAIFVRMGNLSRDSFRLRMQNVQHIRPPINGEGVRTSLREGDLLLSITGDVGLLGLVPPGFGEAYINQHTCLIRWLPCLRSEFMPMQLLSPFAQGQLNAPQRGIKNSFRLTDVAALTVALPPLAEQTRIVARVEELTRLCDALEDKGRLEAEQHNRLLRTLLDTLTDSATHEDLAASWRRVADHFDLLLDRPEAVDMLEQTILQLAVRGLLIPQDQSAASTHISASKELPLSGDPADVAKAESAGSTTYDEVESAPFSIPPTWAWVELGQVAEARLGKMLDKAKNRGSLRPYLRNTNLQWGRFDLSDIKQINLEDAELEEFRVIAGDLLVCEGGEPGRCAIWRNEAAEMYFQKALHRVRPREGVMAEYIAISLESDARTGGLESYVTGATIKHLVGRALERYRFPLPPLAEQARIVARVTELRRLCADLRQRLAASQSTQSHLAGALVQSAVA